MIYSAENNIHLGKENFNDLVLKHYTAIDKLKYQLVSNKAESNKKGANKKGSNKPSNPSTAIAVNSVAICFQIMTRAEPVEMVKATIDSLIAIKAPQDEIIIVDNNHTNKALYQPLQDYCDSLDNALSVHFYHEDYIAGFKAGALNLALNMMDKHCHYIVVVDSDYQALPNARERIVSAMQRYPDRALLQFPQYYRDNDKPDIHSELNHYFSYHLRRPFNQHRALSTGTFAVIDKSALLRMGGWSGESITEDAQMGVLMHRAGEQTQFIPEVIATGLLPQNLPDLIGQRRRWIYGNMQVLLAYFKTQPAITNMTDLNNSTNINNTTNINKLRMARAHLSQLSAWVNFTGVFIALQVVAVLLLLITALTRITSLGGVDLTEFALNGLVISYVAYGVYLGRRFIAYLKDTTPLSQAVDRGNSRARTMSTMATMSISQRVKAFLVHISFWELGALSWLPVLWGQDKPFVCTPKLTATTATFKKIIASVLVVPKLLIGLNVLTVILVKSLSPVLFCCALAVVGVKLLASTIIIKNFVARPSAKQVSPLVKPCATIKKMSSVKTTKISDVA